MAYAGYLFKINGTPFPHEYITPESYQITPNQTLDDDSYTDGDGVFQRDIYPHKRTKFEFMTPQVNETQNRAIQELFPDTLTVEAEYWNPRKGIYEDAICYTPDITFTVHDTAETNLTYNPLRLAFIEY